VPEITEAMGRESGLQRERRTDEALNPGAGLTLCPFGRIGKPWHSRITSFPTSRSAEVNP
jgi:hypothetical protein